jgi:REP element-mobilizing transposase RayT
MRADADGGGGQPGWAGAHLVTLVTRRGELLFGHVVDGQMVLGEAGRAVAEEWQRIPGLARGVRLDAFTVMPNHIHGILRLGAPGYARAGKGQRRRPRPGHAGKGALGAIVSQFKAASTRRVNALRGADGGPLWQPGYRDLAIESETELDAVRRLIRENPARWGQDVENPQRAGPLPLPVT